MASICKSSVDDEYSAAGWLSAGIKTAFKLFSENHDLFLQYFPLDMHREKLYLDTVVDEESATGYNIELPFQEILSSSKKANNAGIATEEFINIVESMSNFAKIIATQPLRGTQNQ